jgi:hypothetical protein
MMDAAVMSEEGMSFDDFQALFQSDSVVDLGAYESGLVNGSVHGAQLSLSRQGSVETNPLPPFGSPEGSYHPR